MQSRQEGVFTAALKSYTEFEKDPAKLLGVATVEEVDYSAKDAIETVEMWNALKERGDALEWIVKCRKLDAVGDEADLNEWSELLELAPELAIINPELRLKPVEMQLRNALHQPEDFFKCFANNTPADEDSTLTVTSLVGSMDESRIASLQAKWSDNFISANCPKAATEHAISYCRTLSSSMYQSEAKSQLCAIVECFDLQCEGVQPTRDRIKAVKESSGPFTKVFKVFPCFTNVEKNLRNTTKALSTDDAAVKRFANAKAEALVLHAACCADKDTLALDVAMTRYKKLAQIATSLEIVRKNVSSGADREHAEEFASVEAQMARVSDILEDAFVRATVHEFVLLFTLQAELREKSKKLAEGDKGNQIPTQLWKSQDKMKKMLLTLPKQGKADFCMFLDRCNEFNNMICQTSKLSFLSNATDKTVFATPWDDVTADSFAQLDRAYNSMIESSERKFGSENESVLEFKRLSMEHINKAKIGGDIGMLMGLHACINKQKKLFAPCMRIATAVPGVVWSLPSHQASLRPALAKLEAWEFDALIVEIISIFLPYFGAQSEEQQQNIQIDTDLGPFEGKPVQIIMSPLLGKACFVGLLIYTLLRLQLVFLFCRLRFRSPFVLFKNNI